MSSTDSLSFEFENMSVNLVALRKIPEIETAGIKVKETEAGGNLTVNLWIAWELIQAGLARLAAEVISDEEWTQVHYRERFQPLGRPTPLPDDFFSRIYLTFKQDMGRAARNESRRESINRARGRYRDILESRIGKLVRLASAEAAADTRHLRPEEDTLYKELHSIISSWREEMRELGEE
jgi:hypothetical protein